VDNSKGLECAVPGSYSQDWMSGARQTLRETYIFHFIHCASDTDCWVMPDIQLRFPSWVARDCSRILAAQRSSTRLRVVLLISHFGHSLNGDRGAASALRHSGCSDSSVARVHPASLVCFALCRTVSQLGHCNIFWIL
jgi:hypothetical protein